MDAGLKRGLAGLLWLALAAPAYADLYLCSDAEGHRRIQDRPCAAGQRADAHVRDKSVSGQPAAPAQARAKAAVTPAAAEVGIRRNKGVICQLLDAEKRDAEAQIRGEAPPPVGESPKDNLVKIERQRSRVGCEAS